MKKALLFMMLLALGAQAQKETSLNDVKKEAARLYEDGEFTKAYKLYSQLVANYPKEAEYNYRLGVCMIFSEPNKKKCIFYLKNASFPPKERPKDYNFYLGKAYHINYLFDDAIRYYREFKNEASASLQKKLQVDREIQACENGKHLLSSLTDVVVQSKKELAEADYFRSYDLKNIGGKLLVKPEDFKTAVDKKKKERSVMFLPKSGDVVYFSSYGENDENGRDIYSASRLPGGTFGKPEKVANINTPYDEDYPFLHPNGTTLYFASKGFNSMGGYDIFRSTWIEGSGWSRPENMEFPINSPDDDFLFVTDSMEATACFSTGRQSPPGKIDVLKVRTERKPIDEVVIAGTFARAADEPAVNSVISVKKASGESVGTYSTGETGTFTMELPNGAELVYTVETPGYQTQSANVSLPLATTLKPFRQTVGYDDGKLKILNYFDEASTDDNYLQYLKLIEKKARLEVNEGENKLTMPVVVSETLAAADEQSAPKKEKENVRPTVVSEEPAAPPSKPVSSQQLADMAKQEAEDSRQQAAQLKKDAADTRAAGERQKSDAEALREEAMTAIAAAENLPEGEERTTAIREAEAKKERSEKQSTVAQRILDLAGMLDADAARQEKEASLNEAYARELQTSIANGTPASIEKLEAIEKELKSLPPAQNSGSSMIADLRSQLEEKEKDLAAAQSEVTRLTEERDEVNRSIAVKQQEADQARKKKAKAEIQRSIDELRTELQAREADLSSSAAQVTKITAEIEPIREQLAAVSGSATPIADSGAAGTKGKETRENLPTQAAATSGTASTVPVPAAPGSKDKDVASTSPGSKAAEPRESEPGNIVNANQAGGPPANSATDAITASTAEEASEKLRTLSESVKQADALKLVAITGGESSRDRVEAESAIQQVNAARTKLEAAIASSKSALQGGGDGQVDVTTLGKQAEALSTEARELRSRAEKATGQAKEDLLKQAADREEKAIDKTMQASEITGYDNAFGFDVNKENIQALLATGKAPAADADQAARLNSEAEQAFRQAIDIRVEATGLTSKAAQLGNFSNAEEKEAEAILKQQQAIELLMKSNPGFSLKKSESQPVGGGSGEVDVQGALAPVNVAKAELDAATKTAQRAVIQANATDLSARADKLMTSPGVSSTPRLRSAVEAARNRFNTTLPEGELSAAQAVSILNDQREAEKQLADIEKEANASSEPVTEAVVPAEQQTVPPPTTEAGERASNGQGFATTADVLSAGTPALKNAQAGQQANAAITALRRLQSESEAADEAIVAARNVNRSPASLREEASTHTTEADRLRASAATNRAAAETATGDEKAALETQATADESAARQQQLEASNLIRQANARQSDAYNAAIKDMLDHLKADDEDDAKDFEGLATDVEGLITEARKLREEAAALGNLDARLGAMGNAEEKESQLLKKQEELIRELQKEYPNYKVNEPWTVAAAGGVPPALLEKKQSIETAQVTQLTDLVNAYTLEFESRKGQLKPGSDELKRATELSTRSRTLLLEASKQEAGKRISTLAQAVAMGNQALALADAAPVKETTDALAKIGSEMNGASPPPAPKKTERTGPPPPNPKSVTVKVDGIEVIRGVAYSAAKPIPIDAPVGDGLTFRVQIGAFRTRLPDDAFRGLTPLNGETTASGFFRYTAGNFSRFENANAVKNDLRGLGYSDAFVVAYFNGKRISVNEALAMLKNEGRSPDPAAPSSAGITASSNVPRAATVGAADKAVVAGTLERSKGVLFTIQVGVFNRSVSAGQFLNLRPIFTEQLPNGLFRYTAGIYNDGARVSADRTKVASLGIKDAFVSAYIDGKRSPLSEARAALSSGNASTPPEQPIVFPAGGETQAAAADVQPFTNGVRGYPAATAENGVKADERGISYKVQIGAFSRQVPPDVAEKFNAIKTWPVEYKTINGLFVYNIGNFSTAAAARDLRAEAIRLGIGDAFVTVYRDGRKLYGTDAAELLR